MIYLARLTVSAACMWLTVRLNAFSRKPDTAVQAGRTINKAKNGIHETHATAFIPEEIMLLTNTDNQR